MKKQLLLLTAFILMFSTSLIAQEWHIAGNTIGASDFLGGLSGGGNPLRLKTEDAQDIRFYTNAGSGSFNNLRMIILSGGNVGIGAFISKQPSPFARRHLSSHQLHYRKYKQRWFPDQ